jgi:hypothetical protein
MAEAITMYQAYDGSVFPTKEQCNAWEQRMTDNEKIESFLCSPNNIYTKPAHWAVAEKTLQEFCAFLRESPSDEKVDFQKGKEEDERGEK